jgi:Flp pilus assembly protein CpaB
MQARTSGRRLIIIGIGVIVLVLALGLFFLNRGGSSSSNGNGTTTAVSSSNVVVALQAIPQGQIFYANTPVDQLSTYFAVRQLPSDLVPFGAYTSVKQISQFFSSAGCHPANAPGCNGTITAAQTIYQNLPVVEGMFTTLGQYRTAAGAAFQIPYGYVAIGVPFNANNSVFGSINPGDDVDLIASMTGSEGNAGKGGFPTQTQYVLNDLRVIGVNGPPPAQVSTAGKVTTAPSSGTEATAGAGGNLLVLVRYQQALIVQHLKDFGGTWTLSVVLRSSKETDIPHFKSLPVTFRWYFVKQDNHFDFTNPY